MPTDPIEFDPGLLWLKPTQAPEANHRALAPAKAPGDPPSSPTIPAETNLRKSLRFRIDEAVARMYVKGLLTSIGLGRANAVRAAVNLSEGGVLILASERFRPDTRIRVRIEMEKYDDVLECDGMVRWCAGSARNPGYYFVGIAFEGLTPAQSRKIAAMRAWFTSPEYKLKAATRRRLAGPNLEVLP